MIVNKLLSLSLSLSLPASASTVAGAGEAESGGLEQICAKAPRVLSLPPGSVQFQRKPDHMHPGGEIHGSVEDTKLSTNKQHSLTHPGGGGRV